MFEKEGGISDMIKLAGDARGEIHVMTDIRWKG
jgi:hypothetical protein